MNLRRTVVKEHDMRRGVGAAYVNAPSSMLCGILIGPIFSKFESVLDLNILNESWDSGGTSERNLKR